MIRHLVAAFAAVFLLPAAALADHHLAGGTQHVVLDGAGACCGQVSGHVLEILVEPTRESVRRIQAELAVAGFNPGPIDGVMGPRTRTAVSAFQSDQGLDHHGLLSVETLRCLGLSVRSGDPCAQTTCRGNCAVHVSTSQCCTPTVHQYRRLVSSTMQPAAPTGSAPRTLPNYIHRTYGTHEVEALDWPGRD